MRRAPRGLIVVMLALAWAGPGGGAPTPPRASTEVRSTPPGPPRQVYPSTAATPPPRATNSDSSATNSDSRATNSDSSATNSYSSGTGDRRPTDKPPVKMSSERISTLSWIILVGLAIPLIVVGWLVMSFVRSMGLARAAESEREALARRREEDRGTDGDEAKATPAIGAQEDRP